MKKNPDIDCLLIGHNEMDFVRYEETIAQMGLKSGAYRDLNMNFIRCNGKPYSLAEIFNIFYYQDRAPSPPGAYFRVSESFSAAIAYLGTYLHRRGYSFDFINSFRDQQEELAEILTQRNVLTVAITTTLYVSALPIVEIVEFIRTYNRGAKIIVGGPFVSTQARTQQPSNLAHIFDSIIGADFYVNSSQGETALVNIIEAVKKNLPLHQVDNIYYKNGSGIVSTAAVRETNKLARNMVDWDLFSGRVGEYVNVRTAVSCPFSCSFCGFPEHAGQYQTAPVEAVEAELRKLAPLESVKRVHFIDDTFNVPVKRFKKLLRMILKNKFPFRWHSYFRCQYADRETVELMKESGCEGVFLGLESSNDKILENMNKAVTSAEYLEGIRLLKEYGIVSFGNFIIGFPGETEESVRDTVEFIETSGLDFYRVQLWYCEHITPIWQQKDLYGLEGESFEWRHRTMDSKQACDLIEEVFLTVKQATWVPQYNFDFDNFWHLTHRGMTVGQVKTFLESFNRGLREKLLEPHRRDASYRVMRQIEQACRIDAPGEPPGISSLVDTSEADFEFL